MMHFHTSDMRERCRIAWFPATDLGHLCHCALPQLSTNPRTCHPNLKIPGRSSKQVKECASKRQNLGFWRQSFMDNELTCFMSWAGQDEDGYFIEISWNIHPRPVQLKTTNTSTSGIETYHEAFWLADFPAFSTLLVLGSFAVVFQVKRLALIA